MGFLIDASILIDAERGRLAIEPHLTHRLDEGLFISVVTASELLHGVHRATEPEVRSRRAAFVEGVLQRFPVLDVDLTCARAHAQIGAHLRLVGMIIGPHDLWLAATCIAHGLTMVTGNVREFERVPGLTVEVWSDV